VRSRLSYRLTQAPQTLEVHVILEAARRVVQREVSHLALDASAINGDWPGC